MAYIGSVPATQYTRINKQAITGTGNTVYQLDNAVGSEAELEVFVNSVRQEPAVSYTVSGQTITFSEALTSNDSVYVIFQGKAIPSGTIPEKDNNGNYSFDGNTLFVDAANNEVGIGISNPTSNLHVIGTANITSQLVLGANLNFDSTQSTKIVDPGANVMSFFTAQSERMRIDLEGRVGIGTTNPGANLEVSTSSGNAPSNPATNSALKLTSTQTAAVGVGPSLIFQGRTGNSTETYGFAAIQGFKESATAGDYSGTLAFYTQNSGGATLLTERMRIDASGRITKPYQPAFQAVRTTGTTQSLATDTDVLQFNEATYSTGGHYNTSTYRFTAPVAGKYLFCLTARIDSAAAGSYMRGLFTINGNTNNYRYGMTISGGNHSTDYESVSLSAVLYLSVNDYVEARGGRAGGSSTLQAESQFSGWFLG